MDDKKRIAFIYLEESHHLYHFISVAALLSNNHQVDILTYEMEDGLIDSLLELFPKNLVTVKRLKTSWFRRFTDRLKARKLPRKGFWYKKNAALILKSYDAVVFSDYHHQKLLKLRNGKHPYFIKFSHGILGRNYAIKKDLRDFDLHLYIGLNMKIRLESAGFYLNHVIAGLPKLDVVKKLAHKSIFSNSKPTVLYTPHFSKPHSSWHEQGIHIIDYFARQNNYNLIFAPHVNLFNKTDVAEDPTFLKKFEDIDHIHIDLGSRKSVEMAYIEEADIYLGDGSSQVLEFILKPRPCIFFNATGSDEALKEFEFWELGQVVSDVSDLDEALKGAKSNLNNKIEIQQQANKVNVYEEIGSTASERYALAIEKFLIEKDSVLE
ncbi:MAG: hypothetical protein WBG46_07000 [Nonlabens sp.]